MTILVLAKALLYLLGCILFFVVFFGVVLLILITARSGERDESDEGTPYAVDTHTVRENIKCPECGAVNYDAGVQLGPIAGFDSYVHECICCGYVITESDWEVAR
jgi:hypothetical protein